MERRKSDQGPFKLSKEDCGAVERRGSGNAPAPSNSTVAAVAQTSSPRLKFLIQQSNDLHKKILTACNHLAETKPTEDWGSLMKDYLGYSRSIEKAYFEELKKLKTTSSSGSGGSSGPSAVTTSVSSADPLKSASAVPPAPFVIMESVTSPPAVASSSTGAFSSTDTNCAVPAPSALAAAKLNKNKHIDDTSSLDSSSVPLGKAQVSDYHTVHTIGLVSYYKTIKGKHKKFVEDQQLHLETHKVVENKHRMLMRDQTGKVMLNLAVVKDQTFVGKTAENKEGRLKAYIQFIAIQDTQKGPESFTLSLQPQDLDKTLAILKQMAETE